MLASFVLSFLRSFLQSEHVYGFSFRFQRYKRWVSWTKKFFLHVNGEHLCGCQLIQNERTVIHVQSALYKTLTLNVWVNKNRKPEMLLTFISPLLQSKLVTVRTSNNKEEKSEWASEKGNIDTKDCGKRMHSATFVLLVLTLNHATVFGVRISSVFVSIFNFVNCQNTERSCLNA